MIGKVQRIVAAPFLDQAVEDRRPVRQSAAPAGDHPALKQSIPFFNSHRWILFAARYFKVRAEGQNLNRAMVQLRLCESIEKNEPVIRRILEKTS